jgi:hypothetical protein
MVKKKIRIEDVEGDDFVPTKEFLTKKLHIEDFDSYDWQMPKKLWLEMKQQIRQGDELWQFTTLPKTWENLHGRAGIALVRDGRIINSVVIVMS